MEIVIAGAGIGGLATAIALRRSGCDVEVHERAPAPTEVGAGLALWPNGGRALAALGVDSLPGRPVQRLQLRTWRDQLLSEAPLEQLKGRYGHELMIVHRAELQGALLDRLGPGPIRFGSEVSGFEQIENRVRLTLSAGGEVEADLLIGADGIRSAVRRTLLGDGEPRYSGAACWRGVTRFDLAAASAFNWWGPGGEFGVFPLPGDRVYWFGVQNRPAGEAEAHSPCKADLLRTFAAWPDLVPAVVKASDEASIIRSNLYDRPPARTWSRGRVTLVGDAAHPMLPNAAQGACQALEDAVALAEALASRSVGEALGAYEARRLRTANRLIFQARQTARMVQAGNPLITGFRNFLVSHLPSGILLRQLDSQMRNGTDQPGAVGG